MTTGHFNQLHEAVTADLRALLAPNIPVEEHYGPFNVDELKAIGRGAPIVLVSMIGPDPTTARSTGDREADKVLAAFVVTRGTSQRPAHKDANDIAERIAGRIHRQTFGLRFVEMPRDIVIDNLYSGKLRELAGANIALMSVSWTQLVQFGVATAPLSQPPAAGTELGAPIAIEPELVATDGAPL